MMLRIHFTSADLARVGLINQVVPQIGEAVLSVQVLRRRDQPRRFGHWRASLTGRIPAGVQPLWDLVPAQGWIPDFLTPAGVDGDGGSALKAIRATPVDRLASDIARLVDGSTPAWARRIANGEPSALDAVAEALATFHRVAIAPYLVGMQASIDIEWARRTTILTRYGVEGLLAGLHPAIRWQPPVLTLPSPVDLDVELKGRGLALAPMVFCGPLPRLYVGDAENDRPELVYPPAYDPSHVSPLATGSTRRQGDSVAAVGRLMGATRGTVLHTIAAAPGLTTAQLAQRADISLASASEHATVLREAGLVSSLRDGPRVRHYATSAARALLDATSC
ncbi:winged helix-turn-helix domain-containing protein [Kitasatospora sp. NBC_01287]|uniref:ArsR/SmtB family transcription factor n=1 Tax=Kitasatospora sp. NBC_01287 TaxID=2903573 RepID=UPI00225A4C25|nr:winged helix-turn-helix domain-containing protein [Kitasatospora sp. NBC_01287]MCX4744260.1 winged helix-turn-helix domain-containing protein [Kitasatospora sp. NBC_01287]